MRISWQCQTESRHVCRLMSFYVVILLHRSGEIYYRHLDARWCITVDLWLSYGCTCRLALSTRVLSASDWETCIMLWKTYIRTGRAGIPYRTIKWCRKTLASYVAVFSDVGIACNISRHQFVITVTIKFRIVFRKGGRSMSAALHLRGPNAGNDCKCCSRLDRWQPRAHVAQLLSIWETSLAMCCQRKSIHIVSYMHCSVWCQTIREQLSA